VTEPIDLRPDHLDTVQRILAEHVPEWEVRAFGSRAAWTAKDYSDLDLAVVGAGPLDWRTLGRLKEAFEESSLPMRVDVLDWHAISEGFRQVIEQGYVVVQEATKQPAAGEWREVTLGDYAGVSKGVSYKGAHLNEAGPLLFGLGEFLPGGGAKLDGVRTYGGEYREGHIARSGDLLVALTDLTQSGMVLGSPMIVPPDIGDLCLYTHHVGHIVVNDSSELDTSFLRYLLQGFEFKSFVSGRATGTTVRAVSSVEVEQFKFLLPPLPEQQAIAHVLGTLDDKIELSRRMNETLEAMARALFKDWFVDFGPVRAKMAGREPYLPPDVWSLFPDRLVPSEIGDIPAGWELGTVGDVSSLNPESWSRTNVPIEIEYVDLANTKWGVIESTQNVAWQDAPSRAKRILRSGDTIVGTVRPGNGSYSFVGNDGLTGSTGFAVLRPLHPRFRELVYLATTGPDNIERLAHRADGAAYPAVRPEIVSETKVTIPVAETGVVNWFSKTVGALLNRIEAAKTETRSLAAQRDALLPSLVSGSVRAGDAGRLARGEAS